MERENPWARESRRLNRLFAQALSSALTVDGRAPQTLAAGQTALYAGDVPDALPLVQAGRLNAVVHVDDDGLRIVPVVFEQGEMAMCSSLFGRQPLGADIVAARDSRVVWFAVTDIEDAVRRRPELMLPLLQFLAQRLREVQVRERVWMARGVRRRVWAALMRETGGPPTELPGSGRVALTHEQLAERAGVSRPKLSQALKQFEHEGAVRLGRGMVEVLAKRQD